jgi:hypothetical protein
VDQEEIKVIPIDIPDHDEKFNVDRSALRVANEKLKNIGKPLPEGTKQVGEKIVHKRTREDYNNIWQEFLTQEEREFFEQMGYGKRKIKKIGIKKFIDMMDWRTVNEVSRWRTDRLHVIPCIHCQKEFALYEHDDGLCDKCKPKYDLNRLGETMYTNEQVEPGSSFKIKLSFMFDPDFRKMYLLKTDDERIKETIAADFKGIDTYRLLKDTLDDKELFDKISSEVEKSNINRDRKIFIQDVLNFIKKDSMEDSLNFLKEMFLNGEENVDGEGK